MDELIVKWLRGEATDIEVRQLERWRAESPDHQRDYDEFVDLWKGTGEPEEPPNGPIPAVGPPPSLDELVRGGDTRRARGQAGAARKLLFQSGRTRWGLATAATAVLAFLFLQREQGPGTAAQSLFPVESSSRLNDLTTLGLSDGSIVRMMPETRVEFPAAADRREIVLDGRAFFAVTADPLPFVVQTRWAEVTVHGTRFEVLSGGDNLRLVVVEGRVRLEPESGGVEVEVGPGQVAYVEQGSSPRIVDHDDVWSMLEWADGLLVYESTPLSMVAEELSRHFGRRVTLADDSLGQLRITAWFEDEPLEEVVSVLCVVAGARCEVDESEVTIGR